MPVNVVVLAAGEGKRLGGARPKVLTPLWGRPSVCWPVDAALGLAPERLVVVAGSGQEQLEQALADRPVHFVRQGAPEGTGHAVLAASQALAGATGSLVILYGDCPLVTTALLERLLALHAQHAGPVSLVSVRLDEPTGYGRLVRGPDEALQAIVEERDADSEQRALREVNAGLYVVDLPEALETLGRVDRENAQGEVYLTDLVALTVAAGRPVGVLPWHEPSDVLGFNDQRELARVRRLLRTRLLEEHMARGVEIVDPDTTFVDADVVMEPGARILPCTVIEGRVHLAAGCEVGPFTHLRDGTVLEAGAEVGNFTETKQTVLGPGAKAKHLTYLGDARIGAGANIGAGTITANYDGRDKHPTEIGARAFVGSGTVLVAPTSLGEGAMTGAGAIVTRNSIIGPGEVWVGVPARRLKRPSESRS